MQRFFFKSQVVGADKYSIGKCSDFAWVTKDELIEHLPDQAAFLNQMIISWSDDDDDDEHWVVRLEHHVGFRRCSVIYGWRLPIYLSAFVDELARHLLRWDLEDRLLAYSGLGLVWGELRAISGLWCGLVCWRGLIHSSLLDKILAGLSGTPDLLLFLLILGMSSVNGIFKWVRDLGL